MKKPVAVGFIGCGKHAQKAHAKVIAEFPELFSVKEGQNYLDSRSLLENTRACVVLLQRDEYRTGTCY